MPTFEIETRELVYATRKYRIAAMDVADAQRMIMDGHGEAGRLICETTDGTHGILCVLSVCDEQGVDHGEASVERIRSSG